MPAGILEDAGALTVFIGLRLHEHARAGLSRLLEGGVHVRDPDLQELGHDASGGRDAVAPHVRDDDRAVLADLHLGSMSLADPHPLCEPERLLEPRDGASYVRVNQYRRHGRPRRGAIRQHAPESMPQAHQLTKQQARRIAVSAQLLDASRPNDLLETVRHLTLLQLDPTAAIAPAADLVAWTRLGSGYRPEHLRQALDERRLFELDALVRPMSDLGLLLAEAAEFPAYERTRNWLRENDRFRCDILELLGSAGPLASREIPDTAEVPWASTGWTHAKNVTQMLELLLLKGEVAIDGRAGRERLWDLAERVYPEVELPPLDEARRIRNERRLQALGIARAKTTKMPLEPVDVGEAGESAVVEDVRGEWRVDPTQLDAAFEGRTALLSPFDRLAYDRTRAEQLFDFEYSLEMYKPAAKRRWGYFALPILHGHRLVGKLDAAADPKAGVLRVHEIHEDVKFTRAIAKAVDAEIDELASWLGLDR